MSYAKRTYLARRLGGTAILVLIATGLVVLPGVSLADRAAQDQLQQTEVDISTRPAAEKQPYTGPPNVPRPKVRLNLGAASEQPDVTLKSNEKTGDHASTRTDVVRASPERIERPRSTAAIAPKVASTRVPVAGVPHKPSLAAGAQAPGDDISDPLVIASLPYSDAGTTVGFANDYDETCGITAVDDAPDVVYRYIPTSDEHIDISLCNSGFDTKLYIYENAVTSGAPYECNDDTCGVSGWRSALYCMPVTALNTYYIVVDGWKDGSGAYEITVTRCGEDIDNPIPIPGLPYTDAGTPGDFADDYNEVCDSGSRASPDVVYAYTPVVDEHVDISLCNSTYDTRLWLYENSYTPGNPYACNDNYCFPQSAIPCLRLTGGNTYYIVVDGWDGSTNPYEIALAHCGDDIDNPIPIPSLPYTDVGATGGFADDYDEVCGVIGDPAPDVVYVYTPAADEHVDISLCNSSYDTRLWVYENTHTPDYPFACNDDDDDCFLRSAIHGLPITGGNTYYIVVDGYDGSFGDYVLAISSFTPGSNRVIIESKIVSPGTANVELEISIANEINLSAFVLPLVARSLSGGAFWTTNVDTLEMHGRLTSAITTGRTFITDDVDYTSPDPLLLEFIDLSGTDCLASGSLEGMITLTFDVTSDNGQFLIDTAFYPPSNALAFVDCSGGGIHYTPDFAAGVVTVRPPCDCGTWGDVNDDKQVDPVDVVFMVNYIYKNQDARSQPPNCPYEAGDVDCSDQVNPVDAVLLVNYIYKNQDALCDPCVD